jgi:hypothetical protein
MASLDLNVLIVRQLDNLGVKLRYLGLTACLHVGGLVVESLGQLVDGLPFLLGDLVRLPAIRRDGLAPLYEILGICIFHRDQPARHAAMLRNPVAHPTGVAGVHELLRRLSRPVGLRNGSVKPE